MKQGMIFLELPNLRMLYIDSEVIARAQALLESYGLKPRDAIHAASAIVIRGEGDPRQGF